MDGAVEDYEAQFGSRPTYRGDGQLFGTVSYAIAGLHVSRSIVFQDAVFQTHQEAMDHAVARFAERVQSGLE